MADIVRLILVGSSWPFKEDTKENISCGIKRDMPLTKYSKMLATKLGKESVDGLSFTKAKGARPNYSAGAEIDMSAPAPLPADKKTLVVYVTEGGAAPSPKKPAGKGAKKPAAKGSPPANPTGGKGPPPANPTGGKKPEVKPKKPEAKSPKQPVSPKSPKSPKQPVSPKSPKKPGGKGKKPPVKEPEPEPEPEPEAAPSPVPAAASPQHPGAVLGLQPSPLVPPPPHKHPYQPYELNPRKEEYRRQLVEFYMKHNPAKVSQVGTILKHWEGEEDLLLLSLKEKYEAPKEALHLSVGSTVFGSPHSPGRPSIDPRLSTLSQEQEMKLKREEDKMNVEVKSRLDSALKDLQELRRREGLDREERDRRERRDREERELNRRREEERVEKERRALQDIVRERESSQRIKEEELERREREVARRHDVLLAERETLSRHDLATRNLLEEEEHLAKQRTSAILDNILGGSVSPTVTRTEEVLTTLQSENKTLLEEIHRLHSALKDSETTTQKIEPSVPGTPHEAPPTPPENEVVMLLEKNNLGKYKELFIVHDFDVESFRRVTDEDLQGLGITAVGGRKRILAVAERELLGKSVQESVEKLKIPPQPPAHPTTTYADAQAANSHILSIEKQVTTGFDHLAGLMNRHSAPSNVVVTQQQPDQPPHHPPRVILADPTLSWHKELLTKFYAQHDRTKMTMVDQIIEEYHSRLPELYTTLVAYYAVETSAYSDRVEEVLMKHAPGKAAAADVLCRLCKGREAELIEHFLLDGKDAGPENLKNWTEVEGEPGSKPYFFSAVAQEAQWSKPLILSNQEKFVESQILPHVAPTPSAHPMFSSPSAVTHSAPNPLPQEAFSYAPRTHAHARTSHYKAWLLAFFLKHDPPRINEADSILVTYRDQEDLMVESLKQQYGE